MTAWFLPFSSRKLLWNEELSSISCSFSSILDRKKSRLLGLGWNFEWPTAGLAGSLAELFENNCWCYRRYITVVVLHENGFHGFWLRDVWLENVDGGIFVFSHFQIWNLRSWFVVFWHWLLAKFQHFHFHFLLNICRVPCWWEWAEVYLLHLLYIIVFTECPSSSVSCE